MLSKTYKTREIESALLKKGFKAYKKTHHKYYIWQNKDRKSIAQTFISHGITEYSGPVLFSMIKQLQLENDQFDGLIKCHFTKEQLEEFYIQKIS
ncbi:hypothetical protein C7391_1499 [Methanimicrococcus blatticola]|uniref:HicA-like toxin of HicAB toxin-antitoxin system n=1 Tax=Methanimicrococcus blatticola TaxID=91560 RepID=A0A484F2U9_9EURY|nr:hypothetical protein C7391_1499 [Methanimicrococcus blatticola]